LSGRGDTGSLISLARCDMVRRHLLLAKCESAGMHVFGRSALKVAAVLVALLFLLGAMLTAVTELFGGSKVRPLFGMSADALAGPVEARPDAGEKKPPPTDFNATRSAPVPPPSRRARDGGTRTFFPASKSPGGEGLPGLEDEPPQQGP